MLNDETNYLYLIILKPILNEVNKVNCIFQLNYVEIRNAMEDIKGLVFFLSRKILKPAFTITINDIIKNINNDLAYKQMILILELNIIGTSTGKTQLY